MRNKLYFLGAWKEIDIKFEGSIYDHMTQFLYQIDERYLNYLLDEKNWLICNLGLVNCIIDKTHKIGRSIVTDGLWVWSTEIAHYAEKHKISIPEKFIDNIKKNQYKVPVLSEKTKLEILDKIKIFFNTSNIDYNLWKLY